MSRARIAAALLGVSALLLVAHATPLAETEAAWTTGERGTGTFTGAVVQPPGTLSCSGGGSALLSVPNLTFTWAAPATPANAAVVTEYRWTLKQGATTTASGTTTSTSAVIAGNGYAFGSHNFSVVAASGNWVSTAGPTGTYVKTNNLISLVQTASCTIP